MSQHPGVRVRDKTIVWTSIAGIAANVLLVGFKSVAGLLSHSIAIVLDAVNNLTDATSSLVTIIGVKLASRPADWEHPFGHGRTENMSAMVIALIVLYAGVTSLVESVKKIFNPETPSYTAATFIVVTAAVAVKVLLGRYFIGVGRRVNSDALINSGKDAAMDAVISTATLISGVIYLIWGLPLEAWLGVLISAYIIKSGIEMLRSTISQVVGRRPDPGLAHAIGKTIMGCDGVKGVYDLVLNNYGPDRYLASVHIGVSDQMTAAEIDRLEHTIQRCVYAENNVVLAAIGVYSVDTDNPSTREAFRRVRELVCEDPNILQVHGFYLDWERKQMRFDIVVGFEARDRARTFELAVEKVRKAFPDIEIVPDMDTDFSLSE